jgi:hypothetical protein
MDTLEIAVTGIIALISLIVNILRKRLEILENDDDKTSNVIADLKRSINIEFDVFKQQVTTSITDLSVRVAEDYVRRRELEMFRNELILNMNEGRKEMLALLQRIENKLDNKADKKGLSYD